MTSYETLAQIAMTAREKALPVYSNFHVGAALLTADNTIITGINIESSSYGLTICAERTAIFKALSEGYRNFRAIAISSDYSGFISPCGACRQIIHDFCKGIDIILTNGKGDIKLFKESELIPFAFDDKALNEDKNND